MKIGFLQFDVLFGQKQHNFETVERLIKQENADLWVLPELFNTGYFFTALAELEELVEDIHTGETSKFLKKLAREQKTTIVAGLAERVNNSFYNSAICVNENGYLGHYRKIHLFNDEKKWFKPGDLPFQVWDTGLAKIGIMICFDWIFPESARTLAFLGADIICHCANLVMPYCQNAMVTRCIENRIYAITANRVGSDKKDDKEINFTGGSQITGIKGEILHRANKTHEEIEVIEIDPLHARDKNINSNNNLFDDRKPNKYKLF